MAAKFDARAAFGLGAIQTGSFQIVGAVLDVGAKLLLHVLVELRTMKKPGGDGMKVGQQLHIFSGSAARAEPIAVTRRFHPSVSSRRRLRPVGVSS